MPTRLFCLSILKAHHITRLWRSSPGALQISGMLLPSFLQDSYKQYKDDTNRFATWLVNIAKKIGHQPAHLPSASTGKKKKPAG